MLRIDVRCSFSPVVWRVVWRVCGWDGRAVLASLVQSHSRAVLPAVFRCHIVDATIALL